MISRVRKFVPKFKVKKPNNFCMIALQNNCNFTITIGSLVTTDDYEYMEYSLDLGETWTRTYNVDEEEIVITIPTINNGECVLLRGNGLRFTHGNDSMARDMNKYTIFRSNAKFKIRGCIISLMNGNELVDEDTLIKSQSTWTFATMFFENTYLTDASNLILPKNNSGALTYFETFYGCTSLVSAPVFPSLKVTYKSYALTFEGCSSLKNVQSILPGETYGYSCYMGMFKDCSSLKVAPELPSTKLSGRCYGTMFSGCTSLIAAPALPATTLTDSCYSNMFYGCTSLTSAPELPANTVLSSSYNSMFYGCISLTTAPVLPATTISSSSYLYMFYNCSSLIAAPALPATTIASNCYREMFRGCTSLVTCPTILPSLTTYDYCYRGMFYECSSLTNVPELPALTVAYYAYGTMFYKCTSLTVVPTLPATTVNTYSYYQMFAQCISITAAPALPATTIGVACYQSMFSQCTSLVTGPYILPALELLNSCYQSMFYRCNLLSNVPQLPATSLANNCYKEMFRLCVSITSSAYLPATTLYEGSYFYMFANCTSLVNALEIKAIYAEKDSCNAMFLSCTILTTAPAFNIDILPENCYNGMFYNCRQLNYVKMLATDISGTNCLNKWLYSVPKNGTFVKHPDMEDLPLTDSGIPPTWNIVNMTPWADYPVYEYVLNGAALKINTGICADNNTRLEVKFTTNNTSSFYSMGTRTGSSGLHLFSITGSVNDQSIIFGVGTTTQRTTFTRTSTWTTYKAWLLTNGDMTFSCYMTDGTDTFSLDNITYATSLENNDMPIYLFSNGFNDINANTLRIHYVKIYKLELLIAEFRPCDVNGLNYIVNLVTLDNLSNQNLVYV